MRTSYPSNLSDAEWETLQRHLPPLSRRGRPPTHSLRAIFDAIFYVLRTGCRLSLFAVQLSPLANRVLPLPALARSSVPGRSCCGPCTGLSANDKGGTRTQALR